MVTRDYDYSRPLDLHRWICCTETNKFLNSIYDKYFLTNNANKTMRKKLLKVLFNLNKKFKSYNEKTLA